MAAERKRSERKRSPSLYVVAVILVLLSIFVIFNIIKISSSSPFSFSAKQSGLIGTASIVRQSSLEGYAYEATQGSYSAYFKDILEKENSIRFVRNNIEINFKPLSMRYVSSKMHLQPISSVRAVEGRVENDKITFENAFKGVDIIYEYTPKTLKERIILKDASTFFTPHPKILANNPMLELQFIFDFKNSDLVIDGEKWDKSSQRKTNKSLSFKNFKLEPVSLKDANGKVTVLEYEVKRSGKSFFVVIKIPYSTLADARFPLEIDPSITVFEEPVEPAVEPGEGDILAPPAPTDAFYTRFSMRRCDGEVCNEQVFMNPIALPNEQGIYRPFREVVKATTNDGFLKVEWKGKSVTFAPYMMHGNKKYREKGPALFSLTPDLPKDITLTNRKKEHLFSYEYELGFANMQNYKSNVGEVGLEIVDTRGFSKNDIKVTPEAVILPDDGGDPIVFSWRDAIAEGYEIQTSKDKIFAKNVANKDSFLIDPVIGMSANEDVHTYCSSPCTAGEEAYHAYLKFNLTSIPSSSTINMAELVLQVTTISVAGTNAIAYNCTGEWTESSTFATVTGLACTNTGNRTLVSATGFKYWNVTDVVIGMFSAGARNFTIRLNSSGLRSTNALQDSATVLRVGNTSGLGD